jgi:protein-disulfide isomerase-like protein with CxxC motif
MGSIDQPNEIVRVRFLLDPVCPWTWRAALWIREVMKVRAVKVKWGVLSLEYINRNEVGHPFADRFRSNRWAMRLLTRAADTIGNEAMERLFFAIGEACHVRGEALDKAETLTEALSTARLSPDWLAETKENARLDERLWISYETACATGAFGVPTLFFGAGEIPYYGPIIDRVPSGEEAADLWDHIYAITRHSYFFELKRPR